MMPPTGPAQRIDKTMAMKARMTAAILSWLAAVPIIGVASVHPAHAEDFYKGRTISIVVGYSPGGGYDFYARLLARHLGKYIPGQPSVIVQNMPGAATMTSVRYLDATAPKDGTVITMFDPGQILETLAAPDTLKINFSQYQWVGTLFRDIRICYSSLASGVRTFDDMMKRKEFLIGATARGANAYVNGAILRRVFHAPVRQITGYPGSNEQRLAIERGELEGNCGSWSAMPPDWIANKKFNTIVRFSPKRPPDMDESVPFISDLAKTKEQRALLDILNGPGELGRPFIVSSLVPADRVAMLRAGMAAVLKDATFLAEAEKQNLPLDPVSGEDAQKMVGAIYSATTPEMSKQVKGVLD
jgi:tripartite-type tricarboxylate transporter receptor subunit TctC